MDTLLTHVIAQLDLGFKLHLINLLQEIAEPKHEPEMEIMKVEPETPPTPVTAKSSRKTKLPVVERQQRKRKSNKESSRRYREKVLELI